MRILFVNPSRKECGIAQFGQRVFNALALHLPDYGCNLKVRYCEAYDDREFLANVIENHKPDAIIYSFNNVALPVASGARELYPNIKHIALAHEQQQVYVDSPESREWHSFGSPLFDAWIGHDPTLVIPDGSNMFTATRPVLRSTWFPPPAQMTFGSSTFGFPNKGHLRIVRAIQLEFTEAKIRFNMPPSIYGDPDCRKAKQIAKECRALLKETPGITLEVTHHLHETERELVQWLYGNSVNIFDYDQWEVPSRMRGVASSPDTALSTRRPLIVTGCTMFRHLHPMFGIYGQDGGILELIARQTANGSAQYAYNEWTPQRMAGDYARILKKVVGK